MKFINVLNQTIHFNITALQNHFLYHTVYPSAAFHREHKAKGSLANPFSLLRLVLFYLSFTRLRRAVKHYRLMRFMPSSRAVRNTGTCSTVFSRPKLTLRALSAVSRENPMAVSTWLGAPLVQAEPLER